MMTELRSYNILKELKTFEERFEYLKLNGVVGADTFGFDRYFNQKFYHSSEWRRIRNSVILRDNGCDLGCEDFPILGPIYIHHMNPIALIDIERNSDILTNTDFLICVSFATHNALHYSDGEYISRNKIVVRELNDTCPWRH